MRMVVVESWAGVPRLLAFLVYKRSRWTGVAAKEGERGLFVSSRWRMRVHPLCVVVAGVLASEARAYLSAGRVASGGENKLPVRAKAGLGVRLLRPDRCDSVDVSVSCLFSF